MSKKPNAPEPFVEKDTYTKEEMREIVRDSQERQLRVDSTRIYGNAFFAESLDHLQGLASRDPFWRNVYQYGLVFKQQFESNTGQEQPPQPQREPVKSTPAPTKTPLDEKSDPPGDGND
jgi:hypothetical protein